jgi:hypothetical protein
MTPDPRWDHLKACCQAAIQEYLAVMNPPRTGAALFCRICVSRVVNNGYSWEAE